MKQHLNTWLQYFLFLTLALASTNMVWAEDVKGGNTSLDVSDNQLWILKNRSAAAQNIAGAQFNLGQMYNEGLGVKQDYAEAVSWYRLAAKQGLDVAQFVLGGMYREGKGVAQDHLRAYMWWSLVAEKGHTEAVKSRDALALEMTAQQIAQAQQLVRECQARNFVDCD